MEPETESAVCELLLQEIWSREQEEFLSEREEAEMDMSDSEDGEAAPVAKKKKKSNETPSGKATSLFVLFIYLHIYIRDVIVYILVILHTLLRHLNVTFLCTLLCAKCISNLWMDNSYYYYYYYSISKSLAYGLICCHYQLWCVDF